MKLRIYSKTHIAVTSGSGESRGVLCTQFAKVGKQAKEKKEEYGCQRKQNSLAFPYLSLPYVFSTLFSLGNFNFTSHRKDFGRLSEYS